LSRKRFCYAFNLEKNQGGNMTSPRLFVSHQSASQFWINHNVSNDATYRCFPNVYDKMRKSDVMLALKEYPEYDEKTILHLSVFSKNYRHIISNTKAHVRNVPYPCNSFIPISKKLLVASPELCFLQAAESLSLPSLILYGFELCGTYARNFSGKDTIYKRKPLCSCTKINSYLAATKGATGIKKAKRASKYLVDGSASARESILVAMLSLSPKLGGFGLPKPLLNGELIVDDLNSNTTKKTIIFHGDLVWSEAKLIIEYDGSSHGNFDNHALDKQRDHLLLDAGYKVIRVTDKQITNPNEIERLARTINKLGHFRKTKESLCTTINKTKTQRALLYKSDLPWLQ